LNTKEQQDTIDIVKEFRDTGTASTDLFDRMRKAEDNKVGKQWDEAVKAANKAKGKFCLTIPLIRAIIKQISGVEIENPRDITIRNARGGTATLAKILTSLTKQVTSSEMTRFELSQEFEAGVTTGQGVIGIFVDKMKDPKHANLDIRKLNEHNVLFDPTCLSYNINDPKNGCKYVIYEEPVDKEYLELEYPDKKGDLSANSAASSSFWGNLIGNVKGFIKAETGISVGKTESSFGSLDVDEIKKNRYIVNHTWWRKPKKCVMWYDSRKSEMDAKLLIKDEDIKAAKKGTKDEEEAAKLRKEGVISELTVANANLTDPKVKEFVNKAGTPVFEIFDVIINVMHHTIRVDNIFLEDRIDELNGVDAFPIVPFWAYFDNGYKAGVAEDLIGTQQELNYAHSQKLNIIKNIANSGLIIAGGANTDLYKQWLESHAGEDGIILDKSKAGGSIEIIQPRQVAMAHAEMEQSCIMNMRLISNQRTEIPTQDTEQLSGKAIYLKQKASLQGAGSIFLNWNYSFTMFANLLVSIIRHNDIFSKDEILEIVEKEELIDPQFFAEARQLVISTMQQQGIEMPAAPESPNMLALKMVAPELQMSMMSNLKKEMDNYQAGQEWLDAMASEMAEKMLLDEIHNIRKGEYNCVVTLSPASETMRAIKMAELFELNKVLRESGDIPIDGEMLIEATDIDKKEQIIEKRKEKLKQMSLAASQVQLNVAKAKQIEGNTKTEPQRIGMV
jgi:hypothetical protein